MNLLRTTALLSLLCAAAGGGQEAPEDAGRVEPYRDLLARPAGFRGPGREGGDPEVAEVRVGLFGPARGARAARGVSLLRGAQAAVDEANRLGGYRGRPFKLVYRPDDGPWGAGARQVVGLIYEDRVWAVLGGLDGAGAHVAEQVVAKARTPLLTLTPADVSVTQANVPWVFRLPPDDGAQARALADIVFRAGGYERVVGLAASDRDGRLGLAAFEGLAGRMGRPLLPSLAYDTGDTDFTSQISLMQGAGAEAVVVWGTPPEAALFLRQMRGSGMGQAVFGSAGLAGRAFIEAAGPAAEGVTVALTYDDGQGAGRAFRDRFLAAYGEAPDAFAACAYDGASLLIGAIRRAGLNRGRIRDAVSATAGFDGVTGRIGFDGTGSCTAAVRLGRVVGGRFLPVE